MNIVKLKYYGLKCKSITHRLHDSFYFCMKIQLIHLPFDENGTDMKEFGTERIKIVNRTINNHGKN